MNRASPWSRQVACRLKEGGAQILILDFERSDEGNGYLKASDPCLTEEVRSFLGRMDSFHPVSSRFNGGLRYFSSCLRFRRILQKICPDIVLALYGGGHATACWLSLWRPYVVFAVGSDVLLANGMKKPLAKASLAGAAVIFANGEYLAKKARMLSPKAKVEPLLLGIDPTELAFPETRWQTPVRFLSNRGFQSIYNNKNIIQALAELPIDTPEFEFHFASGGPQLDECRNLVERILQPKLGGRVRFHGGVSREKMLSLYRDCHVFVSMSRSDGTATSLLEAMASGLYPVLSDIPQNREWITAEAENGTLVPLDQPGDLARVFQRLLADPGLPARYARRNRDLILARADSRVTINRLKDRLGEVVMGGK